MTQEHVIFNKLPSRDEILDKFMEGMELWQIAVELRTPYPHVKETIYGYHNTPNNGY